MCSNLRTRDHCESLPPSPMAGLIEPAPGCTFVISNIVSLVGILAPNQMDQ